MDYIRFAIKHPVMVTVGVLLLLLFGAIALNTIPIQLTPNVDVPIITIETAWVGRSPQEIEREIIEPQEDVLKDVTDLKKMTASAFQAQARIELEFFIGADMKDARQEVSDSLREVSEYPDDVMEPVIVAGEAATENPVAFFIINSADDFDVQTIGHAVEDRVKPDFERVKGVSKVLVYGGLKREVHIECDPRLIAERGITFNQLLRALRLENVNTSAGDLSEGKYNVRVRTVGQYEDLDQIRQTIVAYTDGGPVRIKDLAKVSLDFEERRDFVHTKGEIALALPVYRQTGANVIEVMAALKTRVARINEVLLPTIAEQVRIERGLDKAPALKLTQAYDETLYIHDAIGLVRTNLVIGGSLAVIMLLLFLRRLLPTLVVAIAIPISIVGTFVVLAAAGRNINVISLAGLAFAVGMVVDNAIVVLENIDRHLNMGKAPFAAAYEGTKEVWGAIIASALTTVAVFVPVLTIEEEAGQLFRDISIAICAAVGLSFLVSVTVIPSTAAHFLGRIRLPRFAIFRAGRSLFGLAPLMGGVVGGFAGLIYRATAPNIAGVVVRIVVVAGFTVVSLVGAVLLMPDTDYLPRGNQNIVFGIMLKPPGYNLEHDESIASRIEEQIRPYWEAETRKDLEDAQLPPVVHPFTLQEVPDIPPIDSFFFVSFYQGAFTGAISKEKENVRPLAGLLTAKLNSIPGCFGFAQQRSLFGRGLGGTRSIEVEVAAADLKNVLASAASLQGALQQAYGFPSVQPDPQNFDLAGPELQVQIDRVKAADLGIDAAALGLGVAALIDGIVVGDYRLHGEAIDIRALRSSDLALTPEELGAVPLAYVDRQGNTGTIPLSSVASVRRTHAPQQIRRVEELRAVTLTVMPPDTVALEQASLEIEELVDKLRKDSAISPDVEVSLAGSASKLVQVREALIGKWHGFSLASVYSLGSGRFFLAILVVYLLMAALFESFLYPFVIMFAVPLATLGGFLGLRIVHELNPTQLLDVLTMLGFVILVGVVVNNAILIVHQALNFMRGVGEGGDGDHHQPMPPREAIRESVRTRIRPIFMTTFTSACGMSPLILMPGSGSELYRGLGSVVVGGLLVATVFTLIVVPLLFSLTLDAKAALGRLVGPGR